MRSPKLFARSLALVFSLLFALPIRAQVAGTLDAAFNPNVTGTVFATAVQADGKILIAGQITAVGGVAKTRITRLNVDGTADTFTNGTGPNSDVYAVAVQPDGKIVIGGLFATVNSQARGHIARLNADGTVEATGTFNSGTGTAGGTGGTGVVNSVAVQADGKILIAGDFTTLNGVTNNRIARLNADGTVDSAFTTAVGTGTNLTVRCVMVQADGKIVIAGDFTTLNGVARNRIARLNANGSPDAAFSTANGAGADAMVVGVVQQGDGKLVVVGNFTTLNALARVRYGRLNTDGSVDTVFLTGTGANVVVNSAALQTDGNILLAGNFTTVSTQARNFIARLSGADGSVEAVGTFNAGTGPNTFVNAVALQTDGKILLGGSFASVAGTGRVGVARLANDLATTTLGATSGTRMFWGRSGAAPEVQQVTFDTSTDGGVNWTSRGSATRVTGGWEVTGLTLAEPMALRARGRVAGGYNASSSSFTQQISAVDFTTQVPTLTAPATNAVTKSPITVSFTLPEAAQAGTLTVTFNDGTTARVMTLAAVQGTAGAHTFNFDPSNVVATSAGAVTSIAPNAAIAEGIHTVTLSYKDAIGNAAATAVSTNVKIDTVTQAPTLTAPATASTTTTPVTVSFSLPEAALAGSVTLTFTNGTARVLTLAASQETQGAHSFTFNPATPVASSGGAVASGVAIPDGSNTVVLSYKDALGNAAATATSTTVKIDTTTLAPALTAPATNAITTTPVTVTFNLPEAALAGSVTVTFNDGTTPRVLTLAASQATLGAHTFTFNPSNPVGTSTGGAVTAGVAIPDGIYTVSISYQDALSNPAATTSTTNVKIDTITLTPTLTAPATNVVTKSPITVSFTLPEAAQAGTLTVTFNDGTTARVMTLAAVQGTAGAHTFNFDPSNVVATSAGAVTSIAPNAAIAEGIHTVTLSYKDAIGNAAATAVSTNVKIDTVTQAPTLTAPATASTTTTPVTVSFSLPEAALAGSVTLTFTNGTARVLTLAASQETQGAHSFTFNPATPVASSGGAVASGVAIPDGSNTVVLSYKDALGNAAATATSTTVKIDTTTLAPALTAPATNAITTTPVTVTFNLPEAALAGSVTVTFNDGTTPRVLTLAASQATLGAHTFTFNPSNPVGTSTGGAVTAGVAIPDGIYTVSISYQDALSNPAATTSTTNVKIDTTTLPPTLTAPVTGVTVKSPVTVSFNLPEAAQNGSLSLTFNDGTTARVLTLANAQGTVGAHTFSFGTASPATTSSGAVTAGVAIPDGVYTVTFSYKDVLANPAATASTTNVVIDTVTQPPTLTAPTTGLATRSPISVAFSLPETALAGSVTLTFNSGTTPRVLSLAATQESSGAHSFTFDPATPVASSGGAVAVGAAIPDDIYAVTISYQDAVGNLAATSGVTGVKIDTTTLTPVLTSPASGTSSPQLVDVAFSLPEAAAAGTVKLSFGTHVLTLATSQETAGAHAFTFFTGNPPLAAQIASGLPIPDGLYIVTLSYQDTFLNTAATIALPNVRIDTEAPTITGTFKPLRFPVGTKMPNYTLQAVVADASTVILTQSPLAGSTPAVGTVTITITGTDAAGNHSSISFDVEVRSAVPGSTALASQGAAAPGAGVAGGPPADALLASFGVPTTDAYENVAYLAKWTSVLSGKGSGLFRRDAAGVASSVAIVGGAVPDTTGVIFKTLADPVLDSGKVGFLATLKGFPITVPKARAAVVLSDAPSGALAVIARAGDPAPGVTGPVFKSFKSLAVTVDSIAVFAQISGGTGAAKVTAANDIGLWMQDSSHPLALVLREGQVIGTHTIKTLVSFLPGLGSPGQGRGWLTQPASGPQVLALALYVDKSQAVLSADITGTITTLSETGAGGIGAPGITNTRFASYSVPAVTDAGHSAFLGTLTVGFGGVTKLNQRAIFLKTSGSTYAPIVQLGDTSQQHGTANGATFSLLKDPVLASDDGLAFFATLKGGSALGLAASTIWWQPPGAPVKLLAQGTKTPPGFIPGTQWKAFTGLAIAPSRGPIFTATLKGGSVISGNATGAWGVDFTGATRLLFRSGDVIGGKTVKSFTMLNALVGTIGNTRSFNDSGQLLWLATFTDKTTAIIKTEIP